MARLLLHLARTDAVTVPEPVPERRIALVDLLDRVLAGGVVVSAELRLSIADVDLVRISLHALLSSIEPARATW